MSESVEEDEAKGDWLSHALAETLPLDKGSQAARVFYSACICHATLPVLYCFAGEKDISPLCALFGGPAGR